MKKAYDLVKNNNRGMSLLIMLMMIAVFSVFIIGTYGILNRHIIRTTYSEDEQGAYYAAESVLKLSSTQIDRLAYDISNEYNAREQVLTKAQFITELDARVASNQDIFLSAVQDEFSEYHVNSVYVVPNPTESEKYTRLYDITAYISNDRQVDKKVTGTYGVLYLTESSSTETTSVMIINESTPMLTALENVDADESCSLNGNAILKGTFTYPGHYDVSTDPVHFYNNEKTYNVDTSTLVRSNVKIPTIPDPPYEGDPSSIVVPGYVGPQPVPGYSSQTSVINLPWDGHLDYPADVIVSRHDYIINGNMEINNGHSLNINISDDDCYLIANSIKIYGTLTIDANGDNFRIKLNSGIECGPGGKLVINTHGNDVFILTNNVNFGDDPAAYDNVDVDIDTTGSGNVYIFVEGYWPKSFGNGETHSTRFNLCNESNVHLVVLNGHVNLDWGTYSNITFNCTKPNGVSEGGVVNFFIATDNAFGIKSHGSMTFNMQEKTHLNIIANHLVMNGDLEINGDSYVNLYARQSCSFDGHDPYNYVWPTPVVPEPKFLSNYPFNDAGMSESDKAKKIVKTNLNVYYYGSSDLTISHYMCCANFYSAKNANIIINNSLFYGNIFSSAPAPEEGKDRYRIDFNNSYISCGAIYAPRMDININGDPPSSEGAQNSSITYYDNLLNIKNLLSNPSTKDQVSQVQKDMLQKRETDEGLFSSCVFAAVTGYNVNFNGMSMIKSSDIVTVGMELHVEMEFTPGVVAVGDSYTGSHFSRGFTIE